MLFGAGILLIYPSLPLSLLGLALTVALGIFQYLRRGSGGGKGEVRPQQGGEARSDPV